MQNICIEYVKVYGFLATKIVLLFYFIFFLLKHVYPG